MSLSGLVKDQLKRIGVPSSITETALCTYASKQCYSYRRQGKETGMLSFLLLNQSFFDII
ncbi:MAG: laccase domain-containing protein [Elusimicrobia bacterium]|nr:laccase domain-containing protein [Elusimicrobiota bacterium]